MRKVSKHPDFEVNEKCEVGDLLIVSPGDRYLDLGPFDGCFSGLSLCLNANFGLVPGEVWFVCSFSKTRSHDFSCLNAKINDHVKGIGRNLYSLGRTLVPSPL